jgi:glycolate oxidase iron-sulfur subunit
MADMKELARLMGELEDQLVVCMRCGLCQSVCPLFAETGRESDVARGKLALLDGLVQQLFKDPKGVNERLTKCLLCGSCAANCPSGVRVLDIFIKARAIIAGYMGLSPLKKTIFRGMLARPAVFNSLMEWGSKLQRVFIKPVDDMLGTSCGRFLPPLGERHFKALAAVPFHGSVSRMNTKGGASGIKVGLFVGCLVDKIFPDIGKAVLEALDHHQVDVFLPEELGCCGIPALSGGDLEAFTKLVRHNLRRFISQPFDYLITPCATCTATIKKVWPMMADGLNSHERSCVESVAARTFDVSQFFVDKLGVARMGQSPFGETVLVTYHDPCHLKKSLGVAAQPRTLLEANPRCSFKEMAEADRCCGCGGSFNLQHYEISAAIGRRKRDNILQSGCQTVATSCPACMLQITDILSKAGDRISVRHVIEIYAESLHTQVKPC